MRGTVVDFDEHAGFGTIAVEAEAPSPQGAYFFHCTQIADGSRTIAVGTTVRFEVAAGLPGRWEARHVEVD